MKDHYGGTIHQENGVSDLHSLKDRLRSMNAQQILAELDKRTQTAAETGEELDANIILAYYEVLDEVDPIAVPDGAYEKSREIFTREHPEYVSPDLKRTTPIKRGRQILRGHRLAFAALLIFLLIGGTAAVAFELPQKLLLSFGFDTFLLGPTSGDMRLSQPSASGYYTLEEALADSGIQTYVPTWMPERVKLNDVVVESGEYWNTFIATYHTTENNSFVGIVRIMEYHDAQHMPVDKYEDNGTRIIDMLPGTDIQFVISSNTDDIRVNWQSENCVGDIMGTFTESEIDEIVKSIKLMEEPSDAQP